MKKSSNYHLYPVIVSLLIVAYGLTLWARPAFAATFVVNSIFDESDTTPGDGVCLTGLGECTLRAAVEEANALPGTDIINFNIGGSGVQTIALNTTLNVTAPVMIDGTTQPGASCAAWPPTLLIEVNGENGALSGFNLGFGSNGSTVRGLVINNLPGPGIEIANSSNHSIECNFLGTDETGTTDLANNYGVFIQQDSHNNTIGGPSDSQRNLISGNTLQQINIANYGSQPYNNVVQNNYVGTDVTGTAALGGGSYEAIGIFGGHTNAILDNLISGNSTSAISITGDGARSSDGNLIQGNLIGTDVNGTSALGNGSGIELGASGNTNVLNTIIGTNGDGANDASEGNVISGNSGNAIVMEGVTGNVVAGNLIGTDATGTAPLGNGSETIVLYNGANNNRIGTNGDGVSDTLERNIISNSGPEAVWIISGSTGNVVAGNYIGTDITGTVDFGNSEGISIDSSDNNIIGTNGSNDAFNASERNVIAGNSTGVFVSNSDNTIIAGNYIGVDATGVTALGNTSAGILINTGSDNTRIGTNADAIYDAIETNVIAGNGEGIALWGSGVGVLSPGISGTSIKGNLLGVGSDGLTALANSGGGIVVRNYASNSVIGGPNPGEGNVIANHPTGIIMYSGYQTAIVGNSFFNNTTPLSLNLVGANDAGDPDTSLGPQRANMGQNYPVLGEATIQSGNLLVNYSIDSTVVNSAYPIAIDFYEAVSAVDGQGRTYLGRTTIAGPGSDTPNLGNAAALGVAPGDYVVAMATDANGNTSLFSPVQFVGRIFTVNSTGDAGDANPGDEICETASIGECTLRAAIQEANATVGADAVYFNIPGVGVQTITPGSALPAITESLIIDGLTQPGASCTTWPPTLLVELNGAGAGAFVNGISFSAFSANGSTIRGLVINRFAGNGIDGAFTSNVHVECNFIGTNAAGTTAAGFGNSVGYLL